MPGLVRSYREHPELGAGELTLANPGQSGSAQAYGLDVAVGEYFCARRSPHELPWFVPVTGPPVEIWGAGGAGVALAPLSATALGAIHIPAANKDATTSLFTIRSPLPMKRLCAAYATNTRRGLAEGCDRHTKVPII